jgi:fusion and transport protein UGO1
LNDALDVFEDTNPWTLVVAHATVGALLTPLELVRTRLIVQSHDPGRKSFFGPFHALYALSNERPTPESGLLKTMYQPYVVFPTVALHSIRALLRFGSAVFIETELGLDSSFNPLTYRIAQILCIGVEAVVLTPLEVARNRLFVQRLDAKSVQYGKKQEATRPLDCCVETFDGVYSGAFDVVSEILGEEGATPKGAKPRVVSTEDWDSVYGGGSSAKQQQGVIKGFGSGITSLYRGFWSRYAMLVVQFVTREITNEERW